MQKWVFWFCPTDTINLRTLPHGIILGSNLKIIDFTTETSVSSIFGITDAISFSEENPKTRIFTILKRIGICRVSWEKWPKLTNYRVRVLYCPPPLELKQPWPVWKLFENLRFSLVNRDFRAKPIFKSCPEMTHSNSNRRDPSENFFLSSRGGTIKYTNTVKLSKSFTQNYKLFQVLFGRNMLTNWQKFLHLNPQN